MKIPETSANGPYYGNNENGQWQGVMADAGVSGIVGSGDGYHQHPPAYVQPQPGYMVGPPYYGPVSNYTQPQGAGQQDDFADYMWMENEEEFDKQVMQQLEEEALMEQCIEAMLEDERERERTGVVTNGHNANNTNSSNGLSGLSLEEQVSKSTLNPLAAEFVPTFARTQPPPPEEKKEAIPTVSSESIVCSNETPAAQNETTTPATVVHPEVSAEGILPIVDLELRPTKDRKEPIVVPEESSKVIEESETISRAEVKTKKAAESKPVSNSSKERVKPEKQSKNEERVAEKEAPVAPVEPVKLEPSEESVVVPPTKPINYAAAAKAKVKKPLQTNPSQQPAVLSTTAVTVPEKYTQKPVVEKVSQKTQPKTARRNSNK